MSLLLPIVFLGALASLSPTTIVVFILLLATTRARVNAAAFLIGWTISLTVVFVAGYAIGADRVTQQGSGRTIVDLIEIIVGIALVGVGAQQWRRRHVPRSSSGVAKGYTSRLKELNPWEAAVVGVLKQPWTLTLAAALVVVHHHLALLLALVAFLVFTVVSTATVGATYLYYARHPGDADAKLSVLRARLVQAGPAVFAIVSVLVGGYLIVDGAVAR